MSQREYRREYYQRNKQRILAQQKHYRESHRQQITAYHRKYRREHREEIRERNRKYYQQNKEKLLAQQKKQRIKHRERIRAYHRKYYEEHKEQIRAYKKRYRQEHREEIRVQLHEYQRKVREKIVNLLGGKCVMCGFSDIRALQIDHVNGGGGKELRRFSRSWSRYYRHILKEIENGSEEYQCLCANCNAIKRVEQEECLSTLAE